MYTFMSQIHPRTVTKPKYATARLYRSEARKILNCTFVRVEARVACREAISVLGEV